MCHTHMLMFVKSKNKHYSKFVDLLWDFFLNGQTLKVGLGACNTLPYLNSKGKIKRGDRVNSSLRTLTRIQ